MTSLLGHVARFFSLIVVLACALALSAIASFAAPYAAIVMDARTGETLYSKNADTRLHPASLTKMLTLYITFEEIRRGNISLDTMITVTKHAASEPPSKLGLRAGQKIALRYLIRAAAVKSANDAAAAMGDAIGGSTAGFAKRMNRTARAIGMTNSTFKNANGLTATGHLSTARDMNTLGRRLFYDFPEFYNIFSRRSTDAGMAKVANTNRKFLDAYKGADGIKTGYTVPAGFNLTASAERGNVRIIATIFGGQSTAQRNAKMAELLDLGFAKAPTRATITKPETPDYQGADALIASAEAVETADPAFENAPGGSAKTIRVLMAVSKSPRPRSRPGAAEPVADSLLAKAVGPEPEINQALADAALSDAMQDSIAGALAEATTPPPPDTLEAQTLALADTAAPVPVDSPVASAGVASNPAPAGTLDAQSQALSTAPGDLMLDSAETPAVNLATVAVAETAVADDRPAIQMPQSARNAPPTRPGRAATEPEVAIAAAPADVQPIPDNIEDIAALAPNVPDPSVQVVAAPAPKPSQESLAATIVRPAKRNAPIFDTLAAGPDAAEQEPEVVTRISTSGGRYWGVNVGRFNSSYEAERALLKTQLTETATLNDGLRKVVQKGGAFDANFMGLSQEQADLACRRLQARAVQCFMIGP